MRAVLRCVSLCACVRFSLARALSLRLSLVRQAGSERVALTGATGNVLQQSIGINKSLFVLRKVIKSLAKAGSTGGAGASPGGSGGKVVHPYRDSTLTRLLKHSLGGNSITLMVACCSPSDSYIDENLSTLNYAGLTKHIANNVHINEDPKTALIRKLRAEIKMLRGLLARANQSFSIGGGGGGGAVSGGAGQPQLMPSSYLSPSARGGSMTSRSFSQQPQQQPSQHLLSPSAAATAGADPALSQKLIESVAIIKSLLSDNSELRGLYDTHASQVESLEFSNVTLSAENNELRERIHFLESVITEGHAADHDIMRSPAAASNALEEMVIADDDGGDGGASSQSHRDLAFEVESLREENQRLKGLMIASDFGSNSGNGGSSSYSSHNGSRTARGAQQQPQPPQRTHSALGHHPPSSSSQQQQYVLNQPPSSSSSTAPSSRQGVYSSSSSASSSSLAGRGGSGWGSLNEGTSHPSTVYRPNSQQLQTLTSLQGRRGRSSSGAAVAKKAAAASPSRVPPSMQPQASASAFSAAQQEWERQRLLELDRDRFGSESPLPSATTTAARHTHAWDARPAGAQPFSNVAKAASGVARQANSGGGNGGGGGPSSLLQATLSAPPVSLQLGAPSYQHDPPNLMHSASLNPAIVAYMQQMQAQNTGRASNSYSSAQARTRY